MTKKYHVAVYSTSKRDFEIDRYLTTQMKATSIDDIKPVKQFGFNTKTEADALYNDMCKIYNVVAKFEGKYLLCATNKNK